MYQFVTGSISTKHGQKMKSARILTGDEVRAAQKSRIAREVLTQCEAEICQNRIKFQVEIS